MDLQQIASLVIVAAAAAFIAARMVRRRRAGKFRECADCIRLQEHPKPGPGGRP